MSSVIQNLLDAVIGDGARSTKFECAISFNGTGLFTAERDIYALIKTSQFPGKHHDTIDMKFKGRTIPLKGQTKYDNLWSCTFYLTENHALKKAFEDWIESLDQVHNIKDVSTDVKNAQMINSGGYTTPLVIYQLDFHGSKQVIAYTLYNCFPKSTTSVDVDYSDVGKINEFTVEFAYAYYDSDIIEYKPLFVDELLGKAKNGLNDLVLQGKGKIVTGFNSLKTSGTDLFNKNSSTKPSSISFSPKNMGQSIEDIG